MIADTAAPYATLIEQAPWAGALILLVSMFLAYLKNRDSAAQSIELAATKRMSEISEQFTQALADTRHSWQQHLQNQSAMFERSLTSIENAHTANWASIAKQLERRNTPQA